MNGIEKYNNRFEKMTIKVLEDAHAYVNGYYYYIAGQSSPSTVYNYIKHIDNFLKDINKEPEELTIDDYTKYLLSIKKFTPSYQRTVFFALKKFSYYLNYTNKNSSNPMQNITAPKNYERIETKQKREKGFLTKTEAKILLSNTESGIGNHNAITKQKHWKERDKAIILILLTTGMRRSALYKLDINNLDLEKKHIITLDKGNKINEYFLTKDTYNALIIWLKKREKILIDNKDEQALFISNQKHRITTQSIANIVKKYSVTIEGKNITPHKLRATYGTELYNKTRDIKFVQDRMMHSNPKTTELYIRGNQDADRKRAADIMSDFLDN